MTKEKNHEEFSFVFVFWGTKAILRYCLREIKGLKRSVLPQVELKLDLYGDQDIK
jgi:hypothetical protein